MTGQKNYPGLPGYIYEGVQILRIYLNGNFITAGFKFIGTGLSGSNIQTHFPSITEYKANGYILSVFNNQGQYVSHLLKLDNNFNVVENKKVEIIPNSTLMSLLPFNRLIKKNDTEIILYPRVNFAFYAFYNSNQNNFLVIDTSLNNTYHKQLNDSLRKINSVAVSGNDIFIGGNMLSDKINTQSI